MQATQHITRKHLAEIVEAIYGQGEVIVKEASSGFDSSPKHFLDAESLQAELDRADTRGFFFTRSTTLRRADMFTSAGSI